MVALTLPDIWASLSAEDGEANRSRYIAWLRSAMQEAADEELPGNLGSGPPEGEAELIYGLRCAFLHQGRLDPHRSALAPSSRCRC